MAQKKNKFAAFVLTVSILLASLLVALSASAGNDSAQLPAEPTTALAEETTASPDICSYGRCGDDLSWTLDAAGTLTITGSGDMYDFFGEDGRDAPPPWFGAAIAYGVPYNESVKTVLIANGVTSIGDYAFQACLNLQSVTIPNTVKKIGAAAFCYCDALTSVRIPASVADIGAFTFICNDLADIQVDSGNENYRSVDGVLYTKDMETLICYPLQKTDTTYIVPAGVKTIAEGAFFDQKTSILLQSSGDEDDSALEAEVYGKGNLETLYLPASLSSIRDMAFLGREALKTINFAGSEAQWNAIALGGQVFDVMDLDNLVINFNVDYNTVLPTEPTTHPAEPTTVSSEPTESGETTEPDETTAVSVVETTAPVYPTTTESETSSEDSSNACKYCGKTHNGFFGKIVQFFHNIFYFLKNLFK